RAGRRGIDPEGKCVMALDVRDGLDDMKRVVNGPPEPIASQFKLGYGSVALLLSTGNDLATIRRIVESSFGQYQNMKRIKSLETDVASLEMAVADGRGFDAPCGDFARIGRYREVRSEVEVARMARGRGGRRGPATRPGRGARAPRAGAAEERGQPRAHRGGGPAAPSRPHPGAAGPRRHRADEGRQREAGVLADAAPARAARLGAPHPRAHRADGAPVGARDDRAREEPRPRGRPRRDRVPPLPVGLAEPVRAGLEGPRRGGPPARPEAGDARRLPQRVLAGVPPRGRGAR